ncbi:hypothetical protein STEG23_007904, partial [Scotinomys teguina]
PGSTAEESGKSPFPVSWVFFVAYLTCLVYTDKFDSDKSRPFDMSFLDFWAQEVLCGEPQEYEIEVQLYIISYTLTRPRGAVEDPQMALALNLEPALMKKKSDPEGPTTLLFPEKELSIRIGTRSIGKGKHGPPALNLQASGEDDGYIITRYPGQSPLSLTRHPSHADPYSTRLPSTNQICSRKINENKMKNDPSTLEMNLCGSE